jgi:maleamate amidohydrolase
MEMTPWHGIVSKDEERIYRAAGFGRSSGMGKRPALLIIDVQYRTVGTVPRPIEQAMREFPTSCGMAGWNAVARIRTLLTEFRRRKWPVLYPHVAPKRASDGGRLAEKVPSIMTIAARGYDFVSELAPRDEDILIPKKHASAFFGTPLASHLIELGIDTLIVSGCTTSGCVRASVVDAFSLNFKVIVPHDCVYDRGRVPHAVNLFDMSQKYADVVSTSALIKAMHRMPSGPSLRA